MLTGFAFDVLTAVYVLTPTLLVLLVLPRRRLDCRSGRIVQWLWLLLNAYGLLFVALSEWLFWAEFGNRFDFIAVDYLVYTHEVMGNIQQSYPASLLLAGLSLPALLLTLRFGRALRQPQASDLSFWRRGIVSTSCWPSWH